MSKMRRNLIKIRSCAIFSWLRVPSYFKVDKRLNNRNEEEEEEEGKMGIKTLRKENNKIVKRKGVSKALFAVNRRAFCMRMRESAE